MAQNAVVQSFPGAWAMQQLAFANICLSLAGTRFSKFYECGYSDQNNKEKGKGASPYPMGETIGDYSAQGSISVQLAANEEFLDIITLFSPDSGSIYDAYFDIQIQWQSLVGPNQIAAPVVTHELIHCSLGGAGIETSHGPGMVGVKYPLTVQWINWNGRLPIAGLEV